MNKLLIAIASIFIVSLSYAQFPPIGGGGGGPTASYASTPSGAISPGTQVCFDASGSDAGGGGLGGFPIPGGGTSITDYSWDFGGGATPNTANGDTPCATFSSVGDFNVCLTVTNSDGDTDDTCRVISVQNAQTIASVDGQTLNGCNQLISDAGGAGNYGPNENYVTTICGDNSGVLQLDFSDIALGSGDFIYVYEGSNTSGNLVGTIDANSGSTSQVAGGSNCLTINFVSDGSNEAGGFEMSSSCSNGATISSINGQTVNGCDFTFTDAGGSAGNYSPNENYVVTFCSDDPTKVPQIAFGPDGSLNLFGSGVSPDCDDCTLDLADGDEINFYDGSNTNGRLIYSANDKDNGGGGGLIPIGGGANYSQESKVSGLNVSGLSQCITVEFISDNTSEAAGFIAAVYCDTPPNACGSNSKVATDNRNAAPLICDFSQYCGNTSSFYGVDEIKVDEDNFGGSVENNSWVKFVADASTADFDISVSGCSSGVQIGVYSVDQDGNSTLYSQANLVNGDGMPPGSNNTLTATGLTPGETYYVMMDGVGGDNCDYTLTANIGVQIPKPTITGTTTACNGDQVSLTATTSNGGNLTDLVWTWDSSNGGPVYGPNLDLGILPVGSHEVIVTISGAEDCATDVADTVTVTINPCGCTPPTLTITQPATVCSPSTVDITTASVVNTTGNVSFHTDITSAGNSSTTGVIPTPSQIAISGTYYARIEDPNDPSCFVVEAITVTIDNCTNPCIPPTIQSSVSDASCGQSDGSIDITITGSSTYDFSWSTTETTEDITGLAQGSYTVTVTDQADATCSSTETIPVGSSGAPNLVITNPAQGCTGTDNIDIADPSIVSGSGAGNFTYHATKADAEAGTGSLNNTITTTTGKFYVRLEDASTGCYALDSIEVVFVNCNCPQPTLTVNNPGAVCSPNTVDITTGGTVTSDGNVSYHTDLTSANTDASTGLITDPTQISVSGTYYLRAENATDPTCFVVSPVTVNINNCTNPPTGCTNPITYLPDTTYLCQGSAGVTLNPNVTNGAYAYQWNTGATTESISTNIEGLYTVVVSDGTCQTLDSTFVKEGVSFTVEEFVYDETCIGAFDGKIFIDMIGGTPPFEYNWSNGETTKDIINLMPGSYTVSISDSTNCPIPFEFVVGDAKDECLEVVPHVYVPTAFSPNHDGENDIIYVRGVGISAMDFVIFDRWGEAVFTSETIDDGWDGTYKGRNVVQGVYTYRLTVTFVDRQEAVSYGNITLVR